MNWDRPGCQGERKGEPASQILTSQQGSSPMGASQTAMEKTGNQNGILYRGDKQALGQHIDDKKWEILILKS